MSHKINTRKLAEWTSRLVLLIVIVLLGYATLATLVYANRSVECEELGGRDSYERYEYKKGIPRIPGSRQSSSSGRPYSLISTTSYGHCMNQLELLGSNRAASIALSIFIPLTWFIVIPATWSGGRKLLAFLRRELIVEN